MNPRSDTRIQRPQYSPTHSTKNSYTSKESKRNPKVSSIRHERRRHELDSFQGDLKKLKTPTFDSENKKGQMLMLGFQG